MTTATMRPRRLPIVLMLVITIALGVGLWLGFAWLVIGLVE